MQINDIQTRFKELEKPINGLSKAITDANDKMIESHKDQFVEVDGVNLRTSLIDSVSNIKDNKITIVYKNEPLVYEGETSLDVRTVFNRVAKVFGIELSLPICNCGVTTESMSDMYKSRFVSQNLHESFVDFCPSCRKRVLLEEGLYKMDYDVCTDTNRIILLDDQSEILDRFARRDYLEKIASNSRLK